jgi:hypothetical protein
MLCFPPEAARDRKNLVMGQILDYSTCLTEAINRIGKHEPASQLLPMNVIELLPDLSEGRDSP